mmetsp:Transcript_24724/g.70925  ORF Transcript_24724/g.70925 Transcript_24724/m.70925 type:complete len:257 (+) Transcript_24724:38-808(+)
MKYCTSNAISRNHNSNPRSSIHLTAPTSKKRLLRGDSWSWTEFQGLSLAWSSSLTDSTTTALLSFLLVFLVVLGEIQSHGLARVGSDILANSDQTVAALVKHILETDDNALTIRATSLLNVIANFQQVDVVKSRINFVHHKERSRVEGVNGKQECQGCNCLLSTTELFHITESFHWRHGIELHSTLVGFLRVIQTQVSITTQRMLATLRHIAVDSLQRLVDVVECIHEAAGTFVLDSLELGYSLPCVLLGLLKVCS